MAQEIPLTNFDQLSRNGGYTDFTVKKGVSPYLAWGILGFIGLIGICGGILAHCHGHSIISVSFLALGSAFLFPVLIGLLGIAYWNCKKSNGLTRIHELIEEGDINRNKIKRLIRWGLIPNIELRTKHGYTLFYYSFIQGQSYGIAYDLLRYGANVDALDNQGYNALRWTVKDDDLESFKFLMSFGAQLTSSIKTFAPTKGRIDEYLKANGLQS